MSPFRHRQSKAENRLPSLGLALDPLYYQSARQEPYSSSRPFGLYPPSFYSDDDLLAYTVAYQPSLLFSTTDLPAQVQDNENVVPAENLAAEAQNNTIVAIFRKVIGAVKHVFRIVLKV